MPENVRAQPEKVVVRKRSSLELRLFRGRTGSTIGSEAMTRDEARQIAASIAKLPALLKTGVKPL
jgi:hypothetical protein